MKILSQEIDIDLDFVCAECGGELEVDPPPDGFNTIQVHPCLCQEEGGQS